MIFKFIDNYSYIFKLVDDPFNKITFVIKSKSYIIKMSALLEPMYWSNFYKNNQSA